VGIEAREAAEEAAPVSAPAAAGRAAATAAAAWPAGLSARVPPRVDRASAIALRHGVGNRVVSRLVADAAPAVRPAAARRTLARDVTTAPGPPPDGIKCNSCSDDQAGQIGAAHQRGKLLARNAIAKLNAYDGHSAGEVRDALNRHFHTTSADAARLVASALLQVTREVSGTGYVCKSTPNGSSEAMAIWCVPWTDIRVYPLFYSNTELNYRGSTLLHEWMHRYHCDLDLGYAWESDYSSHGTTRQFLNADAYAMLAYDIGKPVIGDFDAPQSDSGAA
jgi:hypothetical protein